MAQQNGNDVTSNGFAAEGDTPPSSSSYLDPEVKHVVFEWITDTLEKAMLSGDQAERKKVIKQLMLKWHPDKNSDDPELALAATQHILSEIDRLDRCPPSRRSGPSYASGFYDAGFDVPTAGQSFRSWSFRTMNDFADFEEELERRRQEFRRRCEERRRESQRMAEHLRMERERMRREREERERERRQQEEQRRRDEQRRHDASRPNHTDDTDTANYQMAMGLIRQAEHDIKSAQNDIGLETPAYEWACFKAHQAAEKSLKALHLFRIGLKSNSHELSSLAASTRDPELMELATRIQEIIGNNNKLYNLVLSDFKVIPHDEFTVENALEAVTCATDIIEKAKNLI